MARPLHPRLCLTPSVRYADTLAASALSGGSAATNVPVSLASTGLPGRLPLTTPSCSAAGDARTRSTPELAATGKSVAYKVVVEKLEMSTVLGALEDAERRYSALGETAMDGGFR